MPDEPRFEIDPVTGRKEQTDFFIDWMYPAFHFIMQDEKKKPPINTPYVVEWPSFVTRPSLNVRILGPQNTVSFNCYRCKIASKFRNAFRYVYVYAPNVVLAKRYLNMELKVKLGA